MIERLEIHIAVLSFIHVGVVIPIREEQSHGRQVPYIVTL